MPNSGIGRRTNRCTRERSFRFSLCCLVFVSQLASRRREWMVEEKRKREKERNVAQGSVHEKILIFAHRWKVSLVVVLLFLCRYVGSFKYRTVAIENWRAFRRRYFSLRGRNSNISRRLLSISTLAHSKHYKGFGTAIVSWRSIFLLTRSYCDKRSN